MERMNVPHRGREPNHQIGTTRLGIELATLEFPLRKSELLERTERRRVTLDDGSKVSIARFFEAANVDSVDDLSHAMNLAHEHWRRATGKPLKSTSEFE